MNCRTMQSNTGHFLDTALGSYLLEAQQSKVVHEMNIIHEMTTYFVQESEEESI